LQGGDVGVSRPTLAQVSNLSQLKGKTLLVALGGPDWDFEKFGGLIRSPPELTLNQAITYIHDKRADFYIYNKDSVAYYFKMNPKHRFKVHSRCCGGVKPMYLGFSRWSEHFSEQKNPDFNAEQALTPENSPTSLLPTSLAARFAEALQLMAKEGTTEAIYQRYYH